MSRLLLWATDTQSSCGPLRADIEYHTLEYSTMGEGAVVFIYQLPTVICSGLFPENLNSLAPPACLPDGQRQPLGEGTHVLEAVYTETVSTRVCG